MSIVFVWFSAVSLFYLAWATLRLFNPKWLVDAIGTEDDDTGKAILGFVPVLLGLLGVVVYMVTNWPGT